MRLSRQKVERLAQLVVKKFREETPVEILADDELLETVVTRAIRRNLEEEAALDSDVRDLLLKHSAIMIREGIDQRTAFMKVKAELAKRQGFVL